MNYTLNAKHTDGRTMTGLKGPTGAKLLFADFANAQNTAQKYLRPGWSIEIIGEEVDGRQQVIETVSLG